MTVFEMIEAQQKGQEETTVWIVGEQLKDICRADTHCAEIVAQDLENQAMSLAECEKKIKAHADEIHKKTKKNVGIAPNVAERIIREFYGLPAAEEKIRKEPEPKQEPEDDFLDLDAFLLG